MLHILCGGTSTQDSIRCRNIKNNTEYGMCDTALGRSWLHSLCTAVVQLLLLCLVPSRQAARLAAWPRSQRSWWRSEEADVAAGPPPAQLSEGLQECYNCLLSPAHRWAKCRRQPQDQQQHVRPQTLLSRVKELQCCVTSVFSGARVSWSPLNPEVCREGNSGKCSSSLAKLARNKAGSQPH